MTGEFVVNGSCKHSSPIWLVLVEDERADEWELSVQYPCGCQRTESSPAGVHRVIDSSGRPAPVYRRWTGAS